MVELQDILGELKRVRNLLLSPTVPVLNDCEQKLSKVIDAVQGFERKNLKSAELKQLIQSIHSLLESAKRFWDLRQGTVRPSQQYSPGGLLFPSSSSSFAVEL